MTTLIIYMTGLAALGAPPPAAVEPSIAFFDFYVRGTEADTTARYVDTISKRVEKTHKFAIMRRSDAEAKLRRQVMPTKRRVNDERLRQIEARMVEGDKLLYTDPAKAVEVLRQATDDLGSVLEQSSPGDKVRSDLFRSQMLLARAYIDNGNETKATAVLEEIVRVFGDEFPVNDSDYHPKVVGLYRAAAQRLSAERKGLLKVTTGLPECLVLVNGRPMPVRAPATFEGLLTGPVFMQVRCGDMESMVRRLVLQAGLVEVVDVDIEYEYSLSVATDRTALTFATRDSAAAHAVPYAVKLGRAIGVDFIALVGIVDAGGAQLESYLVDVGKAALVRTTRAPIQRGVVSEVRVRSMTQFLTSVEMAAPSATSWYTSTWGWSLTGLGVASIGAAGALFAQYGELVDDDGLAGSAPEAASAELDGTMGWVLAGVGIAALTAGVTLFALHGRGADEADPADESGLSPVVLPWATRDGGGAAVMTRF